MMSEDDVLKRCIEWFEQRGEGWAPIYQTQELAKSAVGGVDAILFSETKRRFVFVEAKGESGRKAARSTAFTSALGALIKRIKINSGYQGMETADRYKTKEWRKRVQTDARHECSEYVLALTPDYYETVRQCVDLALAEMLHIRILIFYPAEVREFGDSASLG